MKEFIEKLIGRLEELKHDNPMVTSNYMLRKDVIKIVNELAEEYKVFGNSEQVNDGWIPCSDRLPEEKGDYLVTCNDGKVRVWWFVVDGDFKRWLRGVHKLKPIAWQPLPPKFKPKGE